MSFERATLPMHWWLFQKNLRCGFLPLEQSYKFRHCIRFVLAIQPALIVSRTDTVDAPFPARTKNIQTILGRLVLLADFLFLIDSELRNEVNFNRVNSMCVYQEQIIDAVKDLESIS